MRTNRPFPIRSLTSQGLAAAVSICFIVSNAIADKTEPGLYFSQSVGASWDPLGVILDSRLFYRNSLVNKNGILWESTKFDAGLQNEWTPADNVISARVEMEPIAVFSLVCKAGFYNMYNALGYGCFRLDSPNEAYGPQAQKSMKPANARGYWVSAAPTLKGKVWRLILMNTTTLNQLALNGSGYFLEVRSYLPHRTLDLDVINDTYLLAECTPWLMAGLTHHYVYVKETSVVSQQVCAMGIVTPTAPRFKSTYAALDVGTYLRDPLFARSLYLGCLVGADFRIWNPPSAKDAKK
jgi:hypothetical protein